MSVSQYEAIIDNDVFVPNLVKIYSILSEKLGNPTMKGWLQ